MAGFESKLPDADMQGVSNALLRAAKRAREIAFQTNTPLIIVRDGVLVREMVTEEDIRNYPAPDPPRPKATPSR